MAVTSGRNRSTLRGVNARLTRPRIRVWSGGFKNNIETVSRSNSRRGLPSIDTGPTESWSGGLPQRGSLNKFLAFSNPEITQVPLACVRNNGAVSRSCRYSGYGSAIADGSAIKVSKISSGFTAPARYRLIELAPRRSLQRRGRCLGPMPGWPRR